MGLGILALKFLKDNWLPILLVVIGIGLYARYETVRIERDHYKAEVTTLTQHAKDLDSKIEANNKAFEAAKKQAAQDAATITAKYKDALIQRNQAIEVNSKFVEKQIAQDKELASLKLSLRTVELFNASKQSASVQQPGSGPSNSESANGGNTPSTDQASSQQTNVTLADLLLVSEQNDKNHLKCIAQVKTWQNFWDDYQTKYRKLQNAR